MPVGSRPTFREWHHPCRRQTLPPGTDGVREDPIRGPPTPNGAADLLDRVLRQQHQKSNFVQPPWQAGPADDPTTTPVRVGGAARGGH